MYADIFYKISLRYVIKPRLTFESLHSNSQTENASQVRSLSIQFYYMDLLDKRFSLLTVSLEKINQLNDSNLIKA